MKIHVQYLTKDLSGEVVDMCGSDGVFILDGRNNLNTQINDSYERLNKLLKKSSIVGFQIRKGENFSQSRLIKQVML